jgi:hypothetical protein
MHQGTHSAVFIPISVTDSTPGAENNRTGPISVADMPAGNETDGNQPASAAVSLPMHNPAPEVGVFITPRDFPHPWLIHATPPKRSQWLLGLYGEIDAGR